jgi:hypothetical protein
VKDLYEKILEMEGSRSGQKKGFFSGFMGKG